LAGSALCSQFRNGLRLIMNVQSALNAFPLRPPDDDSSSASRPAARGGGSLHPAGKGFIRDDQPVAETLVVSLAMIMRLRIRESLCATTPRRRRSCAPGRIL